MTFLEYWKRKSASLSHHWDCMGFQEEEERPRPAFAAKAPYLEKNPITGIREPSFPQSKRYKRIAAGMGLIMFMVCSVFLCSRVYLYTNIRDSMVTPENFLVNRHYLKNLALLSAIDFFENLLVNQHFFQFFVSAFVRIRFFENLLVNQNYFQNIC